MCLTNHGEFEYCPLLSSTQIKLKMWLCTLSFKRLNKSYLAWKSSFMPSLHTCYVTFTEKLSKMQGSFAARTKRVRLRAMQRHRILTLELEGRCLGWPCISAQKKKRSTSLIVTFCWKFWKEVKNMSKGLLLGFMDYAYLVPIILWCEPVQSLIFHITCLWAKTRSTFVLVSVEILRTLLWWSISSVSLVLRCEHWKSWNSLHTPTQDEDLAILSNAASRDLSIFSPNPNLFTILWVMHGHQIKPREWECLDASVVDWLGFGLI